MVDVQGPLAVTPAAPAPAPVRPMRVLVVTSALVQLDTWRSASLAPGVDLHLAGSLTPDPADHFEGDLTVPAWGTVHPLEPRGWVRRGRMWWTLDGLEGVVAEVAPDVVHVHSEVWGRLVTQALATGATVVAHGAENVSLVHGGRVEAQLRRVVAARNARRLAGYASWNQAGIDLFRRHGLPAGAPTAVAPAAVPDPARFLSTPRADATPDVVRIGYAGRLVPEKGVHWLISSLDGVPGVELVVIGSGPYEGELRRLADRRGVPADFRGAVSADDMPAALAGLDIVVVPSLTCPGWAEQFGRVVCEAMLVGTPVVASDSGSLPEVVGDGGLVVPELDHARLREVLISLVEAPATRRELGERGRAWALANLVPSVAAERLVGLWRAVVGPT